MSDITNLNSRCKTFSFNLISDDFKDLNLMYNNNVLNACRIYNLCDNNHVVIIQFRNRMTLYAVRKLFNNGLVIIVHNLKNFILKYENNSIVLDLGKFIYQGQRSDLIDRNNDLIKRFINHNSNNVIYLTGDLDSMNNYIHNYILDNIYSNNLTYSDISYLRYNDDNSFNLIGSNYCKLLIIHDFKDTNMYISNFISFLSNESGIHDKFGKEIIFYKLNTIIICSDIQPEIIYSKEDGYDSQQIKRRINEIIECSKVDNDLINLKREWKDI